MGCYIWYSEEGTGRGRSPPSSLLAVPNVTAHLSTASAPAVVLLYYCRCCSVLIVALKELNVKPKSDLLSILRLNIVFIVCFRRQRFVDGIIEINNTGNSSAELSL